MGEGRREGGRWAGRKGETEKKREGGKKEGRGGERDCL